MAVDFNVKVGSRQGVYGEVEEFSELLAESAESEDTCPLGTELLTTIVLLDYLRVLFMDSGSERLTFLVRPTINKPNRNGGSIIDYVFLSEVFVDSVVKVGQRIEHESQHVLLYWSLVLEEVLQQPTVDQTEQLVQSFDIERLLALTIPDSLYALANNPEEVTALQAYDVILEFLGTYVKTTRRRLGGKPDSGGQSSELRELRKNMRRVERLRKGMQDPARWASTECGVPETVATVERKEGFREETNC